MKISIIGSGQVGGTLGSRLARLGHEIIFGVREPTGDAMKALLKKAGPNASATTIADALHKSPIVFFATPWNVVENVLDSVQNLRGKIIVDCTNPIAPGLQLALGHTTSGAEQIAQRAVGAHVVKAFNTTGFENMQNPIFAKQAMTMFVCGDDQASNEAVAKLAEELGFHACITGPLYHARYLEPMAMLWIDMSMKQGRGRNFGFKILTR